MYRYFDAFCHYQLQITDWENKSNKSSGTHHAPNVWDHRWPCRHRRIDSAWTPQCWNSRADGRRSQWWQFHRSRGAAVAVTHSVHHPGPIGGSKRRWLIGKSGWHRVVIGYRIFLITTTIGGARCYLLVVGAWIGTGIGILKGVRLLRILLLLISTATSTQRPGTFPVILCSLRSFVVVIMLDRNSLLIHDFQQLLTTAKRNRNTIVNTLSLLEIQIYHEYISLLFLLSTYLLWK